MVPCGLTADTGAHAIPPRIRGNVAIRLAFLVFGLADLRGGHRLHLRVGARALAVGRPQPGHRGAHPALVRHREHRRRARHPRRRSPARRAHRGRDRRERRARRARSSISSCGFPPSRTSAHDALAIRVGAAGGRNPAGRPCDGPLPGCGDGRRAARLADARRSPGACAHGSGSYERGSRPRPPSWASRWAERSAIGTLAFAFGIGPAIELSFALLRRSALVAQRVS